MQTLDETRARIRENEQRYRREPGSVQLIAVSKTHPAECVRRAAAHGQLDFGENYLQDALQKIADLRDLRLHWHFIGHVQSNKCREIAANFDWVHSVDRLKIARRLSDHRTPERGPLNVFLQVNLQGEAGKSGVSPADAPNLAQVVTELPNLRLCGLMAIPKLETEFDRQRAAFGELRKLLEELNRRGIDADGLSMGMTADLEAAIAEGATHVRIGTAIFGPRLAKPGD
ncbi:MAG: YggS family pyridoxal phosphate-dependent enzyme [Pseudomonadota bacterium]|nr:YggS family pyridoxal phosphate-dependent enzyme [Pseudomonadota bacterium]